MTDQKCPNCGRDTQPLTAKSAIAMALQFGIVTAAVYVGLLFKSQEYVRDSLAEIYANPSDVERMFIKSMARDAFQVASVLNDLVTTTSSFEEMAS